jgi:DNA-directed RNA polymerase subunit beta
MDVKILSGDEQEIEMRELEEDEEPANDKLGFDLPLEDEARSGSKS